MSLLLRRSETGNDKRRVLIGHPSPSLYPRQREYFHRKIGCQTPVEGVDSGKGIIGWWSGRKVVPPESRTTGAEYGCSRECRNHLESRQLG